MVSSVRNLNELSVKCLVGAGMLQCMPVMMFVMIAGPLTDNYGRKPLILSALVGYLILDLVFLVNSLWFYQLKVGTVILSGMGEEVWDD